MKVSLPSCETDVHQSVLRTGLNSWAVRLRMKSLGMPHYRHSCNIFRKGLTLGNQCTVPFNTHIPLLSFILAYGHECGYTSCHNCNTPGWASQQSCQLPSIVLELQEVFPLLRFKLSGLRSRVCPAIALSKENLVQTLI